MSSSQAQPPASIGRYRIVRPLGSGAMGDVFLAVDPHIDRQLAIKTVRVLGANAADIEERKKRLLREARAAGKLLHPNVVTLFDAAEADGVLYLAFEFVDGVDLAKRAASAPPMTLRQVLDVAREVAEALDFAHRHRVVHRDIKPSNILLGPGGEAKVADFGIAKVSDSTELTRTGSVVGSPQYMSPEQVRGEPLDGRSDLFSLGVVLYELLCRLRPFGGDTLSTLVFEILAKEPPTVDQLRPGLPATLVSLVHRLLAKDRDRRPAGARDVVTELEALAATTPAAELDAPAAPVMPSEGATVRMPSSGAVPPPPMPPSAAAPPPPLPTEIAATAVPAPPPGGPRQTSTMAPQPPASVHTQPPLPPPAPAPAEAGGEASSVGRPSPLESGTYSSAGKGRLLVIAASLLVAVVLGFVASHWLGDSPATPRGTAGEAAVAAPDEGDAGSAQSSVAAMPSVAGEAESPPSAATDRAPDQVSPPPPRAAAAAGGTPAAVPPEAGSEQRPAEVEHRSPPPPPPPSTTPRPQPTATRAPPPVQTPPAAETEAPPSMPTAPPPRDVRSPRIAAFDAEAAAAQLEISTGRSLRFAVEPEDAVVKIQGRGERSIVQGQAVDFEAGEEDARDLELPTDGDYLVTLVHPSYPDVVLLVHAGAGGPPHVVRLSMASEAVASSQPGGPEIVRAARGVSFAGSPADAVVFVDGRRRGAASQWPGGGRGLARGRDTLKLARGRHTLRLEAPGHEPLEMKVVIAAGAERYFEIVYRLRPAS